MKNPFKRGRIKEGCKFDRSSGTFVCESRRVLEDGSEQEIGKISGSLDATCRPVMDEIWEDEEGVIDRLDKKFVSKIRGKCKGTPQDF